MSAKRILLIGSGGAGKSTLARRLGEQTGLPVVHHAVQRCFVPEVCEQLAEPILPLDIYMKKPWEITMEEDI